MVAIVAGNSLGLGSTSLATLGQRGVVGSAEAGRNGQQAFVNVGNGNLVLQTVDDKLVAHGGGTAALRTYNSQGKLNDDNGDNWSMGIYARQLVLTGVAGAPGSALVRVARDGAESLFTWDVAKALYVSTDGDGAYDTISYQAANTRYEWVDGASGTRETYEGSGAFRLLSTSDSAGNLTTYAYHANGTLASTATASGETTFYDYSGTQLTQIRTLAKDAAGNLQTQTAVRYTYDAANRLATVTVDLSPADNSVADGKVYQTSYTYDGASARVAGVSQSDGTRLFITYVLGEGAGPAAYRVASIADALGQATFYRYDGNVTTVTTPGGRQSSYVTDAAGRLVEIREFVGGATHTTSYGYTSAGDVASVTDGEGRMTTYEYDERGNLTLQRDAAGNTVTRTYDARNQLLTESTWLVPDLDGTGPRQAAVPLTTRYVYDATGRNQLRFVLTPEGRVTEFQYNGYGERVSSIQYGDARYGLSALDAAASLSEVAVQTWTAARDRSRTLRTDMAYDLRGQLQSTTVWAAVSASGAGVANGTQSVTQYVYDQGGLLLKTISATGGVTVYAYDGLDRQIAATNALGELATTFYDDAGRQTRVTYANGLVSSSTWNAAGVLVSVRQSSIAGQNLGETKYYYDADNRLRATVDPTGASEWVFYDAKGRKQADIDARGSMVEYFYDQAGLMTKTVAYSTAVKMALLADAGLPNLVVSLDALRPAAKDVDRHAWRVYDSAGRLSRTIDGAGAVTEYLYDGASRIVQSTAYATLLTLPAERPLTAAGFPLAVPSEADRISRTFYDGDGRRRGELDGEGYLTEYRYDAAGRLAETIRYATVTAPGARAGGTLEQLIPVAAAGDVRTQALYDVAAPTVPDVVAPPPVLPVVATGRYVLIRKNPGVADYLSFAELEIYSGGSNIARGKSLASSGQLDNGVYALRNLTDGATSTANGIFATQPKDGWVQIDLGASVEINAIKLFGRNDAWQSQSGDYTVYVGDVDLSGKTASELELTRGLGIYRQGSGAPAVVSITQPLDVIVPPVVAQGRYVLIRKNPDATSDYLSLAELQVYSGGTNIAVGKPVKGSGQFGSFALSNLVDGKTSVTESFYHSSTPRDGWVQVDLGARVDINAVSLFGRTDYMIQSGEYTLYIGDKDMSAMTLSALEASNEVSVYRQGNGAAPVVNITQPMVKAGTAGGATPTSPSIRAATVSPRTMEGATPAGEAVTIAWTSAQVDAEGYLTEFAHDRSGNVIRVTRYASKVTGAVPGAILADLRPRPSPDDQVTVKTYDALHRITSETDPQGTVTVYTYDKAGNLISSTRALGTAQARTQRQRYDLQGRLTGELSPEGAALLTAGLTQVQVDAIWAQYGSTHVYDAAGRRMATTDPLGQRTMFFYTADGLLSHTINALGEVDESRYDAFD